MIKSWMVIGAVAIGLAPLSNVLVSKTGMQWFRRLRRPDWLVFEKLIPVIWTVVFIAGAWSAVVVWERAPGTPATWARMGGYLLLELVTLSYTTAMLMVRKLRVGTIIGGAGVLIGLGLAIAVWPVAPAATGLLLPYLLWSPIGTFTTWQMEQLNPGQ